MNVQSICFVDFWLKGLCLEICDTVHWNKGIVSQDSSRILTLSQGAKSPWFLQCPNLCGEAGVVERHVDKCWCKEGEEWGTGWVCHPEAGLLDSLASRISVELTVEGSRFPRLLCRCKGDVVPPLVLSMLHATCRMKWVRNSCYRKKAPLQLCDGASGALKRL